MKELAKTIGILLTTAYGKNGIRTAVSQITNREILETYYRQKGNFLKIQRTYKSVKSTKET